MTSRVEQMIETISAKVKKSYCVLNLESLSKEEAKTLIDKLSYKMIVAPLENNMFLVTTLTNCLDTLQLEVIKRGNTLALMEASCHDATFISA